MSKYIKMPDGSIMNTENISSISPLNKSILRICFNVLYKNSKEPVMVVLYDDYHAEKTDNFIINAEKAEKEYENFLKTVGV